MSWQDKKAITRIFNAFKRSKEKIYSEDIEALKQISATIERESESRVLDNKLFAKMLCVQLTQNLMHFGSIKLAIAESDRLLSMSVSHLVTELQYAMNKLEELNRINEISAKGRIINEKEIMTINEPKWKFESVYKSFVNTANTFINDFKNYS